MINADQIDWAKMDGLVPAIVQHATTGEVRMLGYMDRAALDATIADRLVTFHSRSRGGPWRKGETSGNLLDLVDIAFDCDRDALLVRALPRGPTCHTGSESCFGDEGAPELGVGLCELVQHLAVFDYLRVGTSLDGRMVEYVDHLHEHFVHPVRVRNGRYLVPTDPGYSATIKPASLDAHEFPGGAVWRA